MSEITYLSGKQRAFIAAFRETGNVRLACQTADVGRTSHYRWLGEDPDYAEAFMGAEEDAADLLEAEAQRRAVEGVEKPTGWYKGQAGGYVREYSDTLLIFLLKGLRPEKYRERMEVQGSLASIDLSLLPHEAIGRIANGEHPYAVLASIVSRGVAEAEKVRAALAGPMASPDPGPNPKVD